MLKPGEVLRIKVGGFTAEAHPEPRSRSPESTDCSRAIAAPVFCPARGASWSSWRLSQELARRPEETPRPPRCVPGDSSHHLRHFGHLPSIPGSVAQ